MCQLFHFLLGSVVLNAFHSSNAVNLFLVQLNVLILGVLKTNVCFSVCI